MASIVKHIVINLLEKKFRTLIVLLTVLLSTLVLYLGLSLNEILNDTYSTMLEEAYGDSNTTNTRDEETFETTMMLAIVIIVMISDYIISSLTKLITVERMPVVGTFRSIGATKNMINRILILEFLFYGIIGATLGIIFGVILLPFVADFFNEYKELGVETKVSYSAFYMVIAFLFGMIFPPLISFFQIIKVNKRPLKEIILNTPHTAQTRSILSTAIGVLLIFATFTLYYLNQADNLVLSFLSVLFLFIAIVLLMPTLLNFTPRELSGGQQQRVAIARALIMEPKIILADEPIGNLDSQSGTDIMNLFSRINKEKGMTILQVTHSKESAQYSDRLIRMKDGVIESDSIIAEVV